jgi:flagellar hook-associated protein 2
MGRITTGIGLVSGINSADIIDQLMKLEAQPKERLQTRIDEANKRKLAYTDLQTRLTSLKLVGTRLKKPSSFENAATTSSDEDVLTATAGAGAAIGSFQFQVARLVTSQQLVSRGFSDFDSTPVGAGTITVEMGGGELSSQTTLAQLNGGAGVRRGLFRITDRAGNAAVIDTTAAVTVDDVIKKINTSLDVSVRASVKGDQLVLTDQSGATTQALTVQDLGDGHAAEDLGLTVDTDGSASTITGKDINFLSRATALASVNDGRGVRMARSGADFTIAVGGGSAVSVTLGPTVKTIGDVIDRINAADPSNVKAELSADGNGIVLTDASGGSRDITVAAVGTSNAATDLGILGNATGGTMSGDAILAGLNTTLLSSLSGGQGLSLGTITITDRDGGSASIDLSSARTVQDVLDRISNASGVNVTAKLKNSGNGIQIVDDTGATGELIIGGAAATALGLDGTFNTATTAVEGKNLQRQWVSENTPLSSYNGGRGVTRGRFKITNTNGVASTIDLTQGNEVTLGDVIAEINAKGIGVTASINANGDGLLLTDTNGGAMKMKVEEVDGSAAADLNIKGTSTTGTTIDGSFEKTLTIAATDTLTQVQQKLTDLNFGVTANVINDGTGAAPFRLSVNAKNTGRAGRVSFDAGATTLGTSTLVESQDAAVFLGGADAAQPLLITASSNQLSGVIRGVTVDLHGVSTGPVTLNVTRSADNVVEQLTTFTESFNGLVDKLKELTKFDTETNERGLLLGDSSVQKVEAEVYAMLNGVVATAGRYRILADVGVRVGDGAKLEFDEEKFRAAYADDPEAVKQLFTALQTGLGAATPARLLNDGSGVRTAGEGKADFEIMTRDGATVTVELSGAETLGQIVSTLNAAAPTKVKAELNAAADGIILTDITGSTTTALKLRPLNASQALFDLRLNASSSGNTVTGGKMSIAASTTQAATGGIGWVMEARLGRLIDPVNGVITRENRNLDTRNVQFQDRIEQLDKLLETKRERLVRQFAQMESVLSSLQNQQQAIGQIQTIRMPTARSA